MNSSPGPMIRLLDGAGARPATSIVFVGGPLDSQQRDGSDFPDQIAARGGTYRSSVRCADDGALRYVFEPSDTTESAES